MNDTRPTVDLLLAEWEWLHALARHLIGDRQLAEDLVQETAAVALRSPPRDAAAGRGWLATVLRNLAHKMRRGRARSLAREQRVARPDRAGSVDEACARAEVQRLVAGLVLELDPLYRDVVVLRYFEGLPPREVAERLGMPVETVRTRVKRALAQLRGRLAEEHGGEWRAALMPLALAGGPVGSVGSGLGTGALTSASLLGGGLAMTAKVKILATAAAILALMATGWVVTKSIDGWSAAPDATTAADAGVPTTTDSRRPTGTTDDLAAADEQRPSEGPGDPVDLTSVDRDRELHGIVRDEEGRPIAGALLEAIEYPWRRASVLTSGDRDEAIVRGRTRSAPDGTYRLALRHGDSIRLRAAADGFASAEVECVLPGERLDVVLVPGVALDVTVIDTERSLLEGVHVEVFAGPSIDRGGRAFPRQEGVTGADGRCRFAGIPGGVELVVDADHPEFGFAPRLETHAPEEGTGQIDVQFIRSRTLRGVVTDARTGNPVAGARVGIGWMMHNPVRTDAEGRYELPGWTGHGFYEITAAAPGFARTGVQVVRREVIDIALRPGDALRGRVLGPDGEPVAGVRVAAVGSSWDAGEQVTSFGGTVTDEDGTFTVGDLSHAFPHALVLLARGFGRTLVDVDPAAIEGGTRDVGDLTLHPAGAVVGTVLLALGEPAARVHVEIAGANADRGRLRGGVAVDHGYGSEESSYTDDLGRFHFGDLAPGKYEVFVRLPGGRTREKNVELAVGQDEARVGFDFEEAQPIVVKVIDTDGRPVAGALVWLRGDNGGIATGETGKDGTAHFDLAAGDRQVSVHAPDRTERRYIEPPDAAVASGEAEVVVEVIVAEVIRGRILDTAGTPMPFLLVHARRGGEIVGDTWADEAGRFAVEVPRGANVDLVLSGRRMDRTGQNFLVKDAFVEGGVQDVSPASPNVVIEAVPIPHDGAIEVLVTSPDGDPLEGASVYVSGPAGDGLQAVKTDHTGRVRIEQLPRVELTIGAARAPGAEGKDWIIPARHVLQPAGQTITAAYQRAEHMCGVVVDPEGNPIDRARVSARYGEREYQATTDAEGCFDIPVAVGAGMIELKAWREEDYTIQSRPLSARAGQPGVRLELPAAE